jgi:tRNA(fMet)-specific endonuclease VapC
MTDDYLLCTNVISTLASTANADYAYVRARYDAIPPKAKVALPIIAIAESEFGMAKAPSADPVQQAALRKFFKDHPLHYGIDHGTVEPYALVRAKLWELYGTPKGSKKRTHHEKLPDELRDRATAKWIGIDERDLLIVSVALQYNLVLATKDRNEEMKRIERAVAELVAEGKWPRPLKLANWTPPKPPPGTT